MSLFTVAAQEVSAGLRNRWVRATTVRRAALALSLAWLVAGCNRSASPPPPPPAEVHAETTGHHRGMLLVNHAGPKGQVHLASRRDPLWFLSVRDTLAFMRLPGERRDITVVYVNDMARAKHWEQPDAGAWVQPRKAWFVIDSDMRDGMGAPEAVPFSDWALAEAFTAAHRGRVVRLGGIPDAYLLGPVDLRGAGASHPSQ